MRSWSTRRSHHRVRGCTKPSSLRGLDWLGRITFVPAGIEDVALFPTDLVVSAHACGHLSDVVLARAVAVRARVAVLPCCHDLDVNDDADLTGWVDGPLAVDVTRALQLKQQGYRIWTQLISADITPKNRLLIGEPAERH